MKFLRVRKMRKEVFAVCTFHLVTSVLSLLTSFKHKIVSEDVDVIDKFIEFHEQRPNAAKLWSEMWKTFECEQISLCEEAYKAFNENQPTEKSEFQKCDYFESSDDSDNSEHVHVWNGDRSFSVDSLCCMAYIRLPSGDNHMVKYYLTEAENECAFVLLEVEKEPSNDDSDDVDDVKEVEKLDEKETIVDLRYEICPVDSDEVLIRSNEIEGPKEEESSLEVKGEETRNSPAEVMSERKGEPVDVFREHKSTDYTHGLFRVGLRQRKAK